MSMAPPERRTVEIDGSRVSYTVVGSGEPLVLLHGWAGFWEHMLSLFPREAGYKLYAFDMPGWCPSGTVNGQNALESFSEAVYQAVKALGIGNKVHVMGQSMGALSALILADRHPDLAERLILASPPLTLLHQGPGRWLLYRVGSAVLQYPPLLAVAERTHKSRWYNYWLARYVSFYRYDPSFFEQVIMPSALACDEKTSIHQTVSLLDIDFWSIIGRIPHKSAILTGDRDPLVPVTMAREMVGRFRDGHLFVIPRAKHAIMIENALEFCDITLSFLADRDVMQRDAVSSTTNLVPARPTLVRRARQTLLRRPPLPFGSRK